MRSYIIITIALFYLGVDAKAQFTEKHQLVYRNARYDIFIIKIDSNITAKFSFINNTGGLSEADYFDSISHSQKSAFFAMTASVVDSACNPLGLFIANGNKIKEINNGQGNGNFFLKPNGFIATYKDGGLIIQNAVEYSKKESYANALQSGPMLVSKRIINNAFDKNSKNKNIRCGIGMFSDKNDMFIVFVKAIDPVTFYQLAQVFQEKFKCEDALTLESGNNCSIHLPTIKQVFRANLTVCRYIFITLD